MSERTIFCQYFQCEKPGLDRIPMPQELGHRIYENISKDAWDLWLIEQTKLMNEYRLDPLSIKDRTLLAEKCQAFLFDQSI